MISTDKVLFIPVTAAPYQTIYSNTFASLDRPDPFKVVVTNYVGVPLLITYSFHRADEKGEQSCRGLLRGHHVTFHSHCAI